MKRIILTTCGTSLFESSCWKIDVSEGKKLNSKSLSQMETDSKRRKYEVTCKTILTEILKEGKEINPKDFDDSSWNKLKYLRDLPAELASLRAIQVYFAGENHEPLGENDKVILLHSNNEEGMFCANTIEDVLTNTGDYNLLPGVEIDKWEVEGLDPTDFEGFGISLKDIWSKCIGRFEYEDGTEYIFNLTGGYKGVTIILGAFAYMMGTNLQIFYIYKETNYESVSIMGFDNTKSDKKERFCADVFKVDDQSHRQKDPSLGDPSGF